MIKKTNLPSIGSLVLLLFLHCAQAQSFKEREKVVGPVKSIRIELVYLDDTGALAGRKRHLSAMRAYDIKGNLTLYEDFYAYGKLSYGKDTYTYDSAGRLSEKAHEINGSVFRTTYTYNQAGQLFKETYVTQIKEYIYNSEGQLIEVRRSYNNGIDDGKEVISYDDAGRQIGRIFYDRNGLPEAKETKTYDAEGRLRKEVNRYHTSTYNEKGQLLTESSGNDTNDPNYRKVVYEYDDRGHIVKEETYTIKGLIETSLYAYEFDRIGNWTKQVTTERDADGKKRVWETYRVIEYY
jgi:hypothetical protein